MIINSVVEMKKQKEDRINEELELIMDAVSEKLKRILELAQEKGAGTWLTALPTASHPIVRLHT